VNQAQKNFTIGVVRECLWGLGYGFIPPATILTLALVDMGRSAVSASLLNSLVYVGILAPQVFSALLLPPKFTHPRPLAWLHLPILLGVLSAGVGFLLVPHEATTARLFLLYGGISTFALGIGLVEPHWIASMGRCIPAHIRGRFFGTIIFTSGACQIFSGWLASRWVTQHLQNNYAYCFLLAFSCMSVSASLLVLMKPLGPAPHPPPPNALKSAFRLLKEKIGQKGPFRGGMVLTMLLFLSAFPTALWTVYLKEQIKVDDSWFQLFTPVVTLGGMAGVVLLGYLLDHRGLRAAFTAAFLGGLIVPLLAYWGTSSGTQALTFAFSGFFSFCYTLIGPVLILRLSHHRESSIQAGLFNTLMTPWCLAPLLYGFVASHWGYSPAFLLSALCCLTALLILSRMGKLDGKWRQKS